MPEAAAAGAPREGVGGVEAEREEDTVCSAVAVRVERTEEEGVDQADAVANGEGECVVEAHRVPLAEAEGVAGAVAVALKQVALGSAGEAVPWREAEVVTVAAVVEESVGEKDAFQGEAEKREEGDASAVALKVVEAQEVGVRVTAADTVEALRANGVRVA